MIKLFVKSLIRCILHIFYLLPIKEKQIYFSSFLGRQYSCNPKYLYEYLLSCKELNYQYIWEFTDITKSTFVPDAVVVRTGSLKAIINCMASKFIIYNTEFPWYIPLRKKQILLQTWHGGGAYKKVGIAAGWNRIKNLEQKLNSKQISFYISSSQKFTEVQSISKCVPKNKFINYGMPRNAFLLQDNKDKRKEILKKLNLNESSKIVLYAPTYRGKPSFKNGSIIEEETINYEILKATLKGKFGNEWIALYRGHYYNANNSINSEECIDVSSFEDMQELLYITDILITDYSSSMWDFSLTERPVFLFAPDIDSYDVERGFYTNPYSWPFSIAKSNKMLLDQIRTFDLSEYKNKVHKHQQDLGSYEDIDACRNICKHIGIIK